MTFCFCSSSMEAGVSPCPSSAVGGGAGGGKAEDISSATVLPVEFVSTVTSWRLLLFAGLAVVPA